MVALTTDGRDRLDRFQHFIAGEAAKAADAARQAFRQALAAVESVAIQNKAPGLAAAFERHSV
jgi:hypothetical protein